jgi:putative ABC transport system permease protein
MKQNDSLKIGVLKSFLDTAHILERVLTLNLYYSAMIKSYIKIALRNLVKSKVYSVINIGGLAVGMAVAILIGLWIWDELTFNKGFENYGRIAQVWQFVKFEVEKSSYNTLPIPLAEELREKYPDFESVSISTGRESILASNTKTFIKSGNYVEPSFIKMMSVKILSGSTDGLKETNSILLSESLAKNFFGAESPLHKILTLNNNQSLIVTGVYADFPVNSAFKDVSFLAPWNFLLSNDNNAKNDRDQWDNNSYNIYAQIKEGASFEDVSVKIKDIRVRRPNPPAYKPEFFLHPMSKWHLYSDFKDGKNVGGMIEYVRLFGCIGVFVLVLACINFMNLATARSEKRAREVGIRKSIGSMRSQLVFQFLTESFLFVFIGFFLSLILVQMVFPLFNQVADKKVIMLWTNPLFWLLCLSCCLITGLLAGSYPALYLSSFLPFKVLKGTFRISRFASVPRKFLVVFQFTVSITMIIGFAVIFKQIEFAKARSVGYDRNNLIEVRTNTPQLYGHFEALRNDLLTTGAVSDMSESTGSVTVQYGGTTNVTWQGKEPDTRPLLMSNRVTHEYGKTVGWQIVNGRDFSREMIADTSSVIINESAMKLMDFKKPLSEIVKYNGKDYNVIGVIKDMIKESPFEPVKPTFYVLDYDAVNMINIKLASQMSTSEALVKVEEVFKRHNPNSPLDYSFVDERYGKKFSAEERIGKLSSFFALLATVISSLGIFGLASFNAEQRTKEIGIKKVLGASILQLWQMLSKDFVLLVVISSVLSIPISYFFMSSWLQNYEYRTEISAWIFVAATIGTLLIALLTVSFQTIKAAIVNPVNSLRSE